MWLRRSHCPWLSSKKPETATSRGQRVAEECQLTSHQCNFCSKSDKGVPPFLQHSGGQAVGYCSKACQREHWLTHKVLCNSIQHLVSKEGTLPKGVGDSSEVYSHRIFSNNTG